MRTHITSIALLVTYIYRKIILKVICMDNDLSTWILSGISVVGQATKKVELCFAAFVAAHTATRSIDHLGELLLNIGKGSILENIRLHRTKCTRLINNVISPAMVEELVNDIGSHGFFIILDESTDIAIMKYLACCVRFYSSKRKCITKCITNDFLGIIEIEKATGKMLCDATVAYLSSLGLNYKNVIGIGSDGAAKT